jgi:hypothetical protein
VIRILIGLFALIAAIPVAAQQAPLPADQAALKAHIQFLASDALRGRKAGTRAFDIAAEYVAAQMEAIGLKPGAAGEWYQPVKLVSYQASDKANWTLTRGGTAIPLQHGTDFVNGAVPGTPAFKAEGGVVFAGYGLVYPAGGIDDYAGIDVRGKIVAVLAGVPNGLPSEVQAHFDDDDQKAVIAQAHGARAVIILESVARRAELPFEALAPYYNYERMTWAGPDGIAFTPARESPVVGYVGHAGAQKLFQGAKIRWADVQAAQTKGTRMPRGPLAASLAVETSTTETSRPSRNVIGLLEGSDRKDEYVVLSAHLDHVGVGQAVKGDVIYNGAMDNASGVSVLLETAKRLAQGKRPSRSILFLALTAEEEGLIGSDYFAHRPVVPKDRLVADLNMDMPILTYTLADLVVLGGERSSIGPAVEKAAAAEGLKVVPDPEPEENFFVRSDHYSFVKSGIPAVSIDTGPGGEGAVATRLFLDQNYHKPSDQIDLPFNWEAAAQYARVTLAVARALADAPERPRWNKGDFFGVQFDGYGAK